MNLLQTSILTTTLLLGSIACSSSRNISNAKEASMSEVEQHLKQIQTESSIPGLQVEVTEGDRPVFKYIRGVRAHGRSEAVTSKDQWHIGSCTKPMTAFLIGRLVDRQQMGWQTSLGEIIPAHYRVDPSVKVITVEQLLSHSSGLVDIMEPDSGKLWPTLFTDAIDSQTAREKLVKGVLKMPVRFKPGSKFEYSNSGYVVLGWILEKISSTSWEQVMRQDLFQKLGMNSCGFGPAGVEDKKTPTQPWSHQFEKNNLKAIPPGIAADNPPALGPAGTVHCSVEDWRKFLSLFLANEGVRSGYLTQGTFDKLLSQSGEGPYTLSSMGRKERAWAKGPAFAMAGSNTMNYAIVGIAPNLNRIFTINMNAGHAKAEESATKILKLLTEMK